MSGPNAEFAQLYVRTTADTAFWELELWSDQGEAHIECAKCGSGELAKAGVRGKRLTLTDLMARLEAHLPNCHSTRESRQAPDRLELGQE